jgi:hypothetical protein
VRPADAIEGRGEDRHDRQAVLAAVDQVGEDIAGVLVSSDALEEAPQRGRAERTLMRRQWFPLHCMGFSQWFSYRWEDNSAFYGW